MAGDRKQQEDWDNGPDDWEDEAAPESAGPQVGAGETFVNRTVNALPGGRLITDTLSTAAMQGAKALGVGESGVKFTPAADAELRSMGVDKGPDSTIGGVVDTYRDVRDTRAQRTEAGADQNPWAARFGTAAGIGLSLLAPLPKGKGGLGGNALTGAGYGALEGLTNGPADLTRGEFGQAAVDTLKGAGAGAGFGALGHGVAELGRKGMRALRGARGEVLQQETGALREAAAEGQEALAKDVSKHRELVGKAKGLMERDIAGRERVHGQALEANKARDARAVRTDDRAAKILERAQRKGAPPPDPSTKVLDGYHGKAHQAQQHRSDKALEYRRGMGELDLDTQVASSRQDYIDRMPNALSDPPALRREFMAKFLRRKYGDAMAERIMRERVGPGGEILASRPPAAGGADELAAPSLADEAEAAMAARRGEQPQLPSGQGELPLMAPLETAAPSPLEVPWTPNAPRASASPVLTAQPVRRGNSPAFDVGGRPPPNFEQAPTRAGGAALSPPTTPENSMVAPRDMPLEAPPTRVVTVPEVRRPTQPRPSPAPAPPAASQGPAAVAAPVLQPPARPVDDIQDVTRLVGPDDVAPLAAERASARESGAFGAVARAGYEGVKGGNNILGAALGGMVGVTKEALRDPAVKARVLSMARLHVLARLNPELFARVGGTLAAAATKGDSTYRAQKYLEIRRHPDLRVAEQQAAEEAGQMSDDQLMQLIAGTQLSSGGPPP